jgi:hypothetical protein
VFYRGGAEEARGAHNLEVIGSNPISGIIITSHRCITALEQLYTSLAQRTARWTHNPEDTGSKPVGGIRQSLRDAKLALHRCGAEAAREAHNLEVTGSKPVAGISTSQFHRTAPLSLQHFAGVAQWQSA